MPQPTFSEAHAFALAFSKLRFGCASACMELTTIRHLRWHAAFETLETRGTAETRETREKPETRETRETPGTLETPGTPKALVDR